MHKLQTSGITFQSEFQPGLILKPNAKHETCLKILLRAWFWNRMRKMRHVLKSGFEFCFKTECEKMRHVSKPGFGFDFETECEKWDMSRIPASSLILIPNAKNETCFKIRLRVLFWDRMRKTDTCLKIRLRVWFWNQLRKMRHVSASGFGFDFENECEKWDMSYNPASGFILRPNAKNETCLKIRLRVWSWDRMRKMLIPGLRDPLRIQQKKCI